MILKCERVEVSLTHEKTMRSETKSTLEERKDSVLPVKSRYGNDVFHALFVPHVAACLKV